MTVIEQYDHLDSANCPAGSYLITTVNGSVYEVAVPEFGPTTMRRLRDETPVDPEYGVRSIELYSDGDPIPVLAWAAFRDVRGAIFVFYAEDARKCESVSEYVGSIRHTSAVIAIERVSPTPDEGSRDGKQAE